MTTNKSEIAKDKFIAERSRKYFWEQKFREVGILFVIFFGLFVFWEITAFLPTSVCDRLGNRASGNEVCDNGERIGFIICSILMLTTIGLILWGWIYLNNEKAHDRAIEDWDNIHDKTYKGGDKNDE